MKYVSWVLNDDFLFFSWAVAVPSHYCYKRGRKKEREREREREREWTKEKKGKKKVRKD
jgi:hypothetical protein